MCAVPRAQPKTDAAAAQPLSVSRPSAAISLYLPVAVRDVISASASASAAAVAVSIATAATGANDAVPFDVVRRLCWVQAGRVG